MAVCARAAELAGRSGYPFVFVRFILMRILVPTESLCFPCISISTIHTRTHISTNPGIPPPPLVFVFVRFIRIRILVLTQAFGLTAELAGR